MPTPPVAPETSTTSSATTSSASTTSSAAAAARPIAADSSDVTPSGTGASVAASWTTYSAMPPAPRPRAWIAPPTRSPIASPSPRRPTPDRESVDARADRLHQTGEVAAEHDGELVRHRVPEVAGCDGDVEAVD